MELSILLSLQPLIGAIAAGNCCVLKPSEHAPHCASLLKKMIGEVFPSHYVAVINGGVEISEKLLEQSFDHIFYTGGERVGKIVMEKSIETFNTSDFGIRWKKSMHCRRKCQY